MEHKRYVVAFATDTSYTKAVNKSPVSVFDIEHLQDMNRISILPNHQLISNNSGVIYNIWSSHHNYTAAKNRSHKLSKLAMFDTDYEFEITKKGYTVRGGAGNKLRDVVKFEEII